MTPTEQPTVRTRKPRGQGASRRGEILAAAKRLFLEEGVQHVTMRRIAAAVGVSATALYVYFPDKDAILQAIATEHFAALLARLEEVMDPAQSEPKNLRSGLRAYVAFALARPDEYRLTFLQAGRGDDPCKDLPEADRSFDMLVRSVERMVAEGIYPADKPVILMAEALWACVHGVVSILLTIPEECASDPAALAEQTIDMAIAGLCVNGVNLSLLR